MIAACDECFEVGVITEAATKYRGGYYCGSCALEYLGALPALLATHLMKVPA